MRTCTVTCARHNKETLTGKHLMQPLWQEREKVRTGQAAIGKRSGHQLEA